MKISCNKPKISNDAKIKASKLMGFIKDNILIHDNEEARALIFAAFYKSAMHN